VNANELTLSRIKQIAATTNGVAGAETLMVVTGCEGGLHPEFALFLSSRKDFAYTAAYQQQQQHQHQQQQQQEKQEKQESDSNNLLKPIQQSPSTRPKHSPSLGGRGVTSPNSNEEDGALEEEGASPHEAELERERRRSSLLSSVGNYKNFASLGKDASNTNQNFNFIKQPNSGKKHDNVQSASTTISVYIFGDEANPIEIPCTLKITLLFPDHKTVERILPEGVIDNMQVCNFSSGWRRDVVRDLYNYIYEEEDGMMSKWQRSEERKVERSSRRKSTSGGGVGGGSSSSSNSSRGKNRNTSSGAVESGGGGGGENPDYILRGKFFTKTTSNLLLAREEISDAIFRLQSLDDEVSTIKTHQTIISSLMEMDNITNRLIIELTRSKTEMSVGEVRKLSP